MEEFLCFPVTPEEKRRFQKACSALNLKVEEWFRRALVESELNVAMRDFSDPDISDKPSKNQSKPPKKKDKDS
ncbi:hypothetical protein CEB3_c06340 [Peptococcaceae bacterium CEB3]|nr:hypothetical protein CEB3_c06340 [Peptococcaceae bacterium CEB3]